MPGFFSRRSGLGLGLDVLSGSYAGLKQGFFGSLFLTASGGALVSSAMTAAVGACALGGAIVILPAIFLKQALMDNITSTVALSFMDPLLNFAFSFAAGYVGATILGLAAMPVALTALSGAIMLYCLSNLHVSLFNFSAIAADVAEEPLDRAMALSFA